MLYQLSPSLSPLSPYPPPPEINNRDYPSLPLSLDRGEGDIDISGILTL